jgi:hypothetical protein
MLITESFGLGFLMLLTPYFLQCHLSSLIKIKAGRNLVPWLYLILLLDVSGAIGFSLFDKKYYALKRLGDAIISIPIIRTLALYQNVMSVRDARVVTIQTLQTVEGYSFFLTLLASCGYWFADHAILGKLSHAIRLTSIFMTWTRAMFHAFLLNLMDEALEVQPGGTADQPSFNDENNESSPFFEEESVQIQPLFGRKP